MNDRMETLLEKFKHLEEELLVEIQRKEKELRYEIRQGRVHFTQRARDDHRKLVKKLRHYLTDAKFLNIVTAPVIWSCVIPILFLDLWATVYQFICFPAYGIPKVVRRDYVVMDRRKLGYLNSMEKFNCVYCEYVNGLIAYVQEIAGRTEQYWCPIKHALRLKTTHTRYRNFLDYGAAEEYRERIEKVRRNFKDLESSSSPAIQSDTPELKARP